MSGRGGRGGKGSKSARGTSRKGGKALAKGGKGRSKGGKALAKGGKGRSKGGKALAKGGKGRNKGGKANGSKNNGGRANGGKSGKNYYAKHGTKFRHGYYYKGRHHNHWSERTWSDDYGFWLYLDPDLGVYYYWAEADETYYPITYWDATNNNSGGVQVTVDPVDPVIEN
jgi:hypothetical protein